jgi:hypothetical protein
MLEAIWKPLLKLSGRPMEASPGRLRAVKRRNIFDGVWNETL